jgi:protein-disulfide isomerase-like protein with CxxC motif
VAEGQPDVWDAPESDSGLLALQAAIVVRERYPDQFLDVHRALFELRHDHGGSLRDRDVVGGVLEAYGVDAAKVWGEVDGGWPLAMVKAEHEAWVESHQVWGVPTFIVGDAAAFVRLLEAPSDADEAISSVERIVDLLAWSELNEFKHTSIPR